jgi:hypothetical protein
MFRFIGETPQSAPAATSMPKQMGKAKNDWFLRCALNFGVLLFFVCFTMSSPRLLCAYSVRILVKD